MAVITIYHHKVSHVDDLSVMQNNGGLFRQMSI